METYYSRLFLHNQKLSETKSRKYLGVSFSHDLIRSDYINNTATKGHKTLGFLRRNFRRCTPSVKATTYKTMVRPILEYASTVWDPAEGDTSDANLLERVQRATSCSRCSQQLHGPDPRLCD